MPRFSSLPRYPNLKSSQRGAAKARVAGLLQQTDDKGIIITSKRVVLGRELIIGRHRLRCQLHIDDPCVSARHVRIYTIAYDDNDSTDVDCLVYAEDLSKNGTYWNGSMIGKGKGGFLLSQDDVLKLAPNVQLVFKEARPSSTESHFDEVQEEELQNFANSYVVTDRLLGAGAFGRVFMAIEQKTRSQFACKIVDLRKLRPTCSFGRGLINKAKILDTDVETNKSLTTQVKEWSKRLKKTTPGEKLKIYYREAEILSSIKHPNIIGLEKLFITDNTIYLIQELVTGGDLFSYIESKNGKLSEGEAAVIIQQIAVAVAFLHDNNIVHRDLKPDNILMTQLSAGCRVVLTDFGAARRIGQPLSRMLSVAGTDEYSAPETALDAKGKVGGYTKAVDMWSLGCVATVLLTGGHAFADPVTRLYSHTMARQCDLNALESSREWKAVCERPKKFVRKLLTLSEEERMTARDALNDPWFTNDINRDDFKNIYERSIKNWHRPAMHEVLNFRHAFSAKQIAIAEGVIPEKRGRSHDAVRLGQIVDAHYKPFARQMNQQLSPARKPHPQYVSAETKSAIKDSWPRPHNRVSIYANGCRLKRKRSRSSSESPVRDALDTKTSTSIARTENINDTLHGHHGAAAKQQDLCQEKLLMPPPPPPKQACRVSFEAVVPLRPLDPNVQYSGDPIKFLAPLVPQPPWSTLMPPPPQLKDRAAPLLKDTRKEEAYANSAAADDTGPISKDQPPSTPNLQRDLPTPLSLGSRMGGGLKRRPLSLSTNASPTSPRNTRLLRRTSVYDFSTSDQENGSPLQTTPSRRRSTDIECLRQEDLSLPHHSSLILDMDEFA